MKLSSIERSHWLNCLNYLFRNGHEMTPDQLYAELLSDYVIEQDLFQLLIESMIP